MRALEAQLNAAKAKIAEAERRKEEKRKAEEEAKKKAAEEARKRAEEEAERLRVEAAQVREFRNSLYRQIAEYEGWTAQRTKEAGKARQMAKKAGRKAPKTPSVVPDDEDDEDIPPPFKDATLELAEVPCDRCKALGKACAYVVGDKSTSCVGCRYRKTKCLQEAEGASVSRRSMVGPDIAGVLATIAAAVERLAEASERTAVAVENIEELLREERKEGGKEKVDVKGKGVIRRPRRSLEEEEDVEMEKGDVEEVEDDAEGEEEVEEEEDEVMEE